MTQIEQRNKQTHKKLKNILILYIDYIIDRAAKKNPELTVAETGAIDVTNPTYALLVTVTASVCDPVPTVALLSNIPPPNGAEPRTADPPDDTKPPGP